MRDELGDRCKALEDSSRFPRGVQILARADGRAFSSWTKGLEYPFDERYSDLMVATTTSLMRETSACFGYTQSDEITLVLEARSEESQLWFDGRVQKIVSSLAAWATGAFNHLLPHYLPAKVSDRSFPTFDARVWAVPSRAEACEAVLWRAQDAERNSVLMAAHAVFSTKEVHNKNAGELKRMLEAAEKPWDDLPARFRRGTMVQRRAACRAFTSDEFEKLPPKHEARRNPELVVERQDLIASPFVCEADLERAIFENCSRRW